MNDQNFAFLLKSLVATGFDPIIHRLLHRRLQWGLPAFLLPVSASFAKYQLEATIYIRKWQDCPMYYLHKYHATLRTGTNDPPLSQDFFFSRMYPVITLREAGSLLSGQPLFRDSCRYKDQTYSDCWLWLDFRQTDSQGNFLWVFKHQSKTVST